MPKRVPPLYAPSPMPTWGPEGVNLRDASAGEVLEVRFFEAVKQGEGGGGGVPRVLAI